MWKKNLMLNILFIGIFFNSAVAQSMKIYKKDGTVRHELLSMIDSIAFVTTSGEGYVTDIDGNIYPTVLIGTQVWMAENLKVTRYRNGDPIPNVTDNTEWGNLSSGAYCNYANDPFYVGDYGRLYNWYAVKDARGLAPEGWHIPSDGEWQNLINFLGGDAVAGGKLKSTGTIQDGTGLWNQPNTGATNESGFTALPGGWRNYDDGTFRDIGYSSDWWSSAEYSSTSAWNRGLGNDVSYVVRGGINKQNGCSVRCVRD